MGVVNQAAQDGVGLSGVADSFVPVLDRQLAGDGGGGAAMAVFEDFREVAALRGGEDGQAPIVDDQHIHAGDGLEDAVVAAVATGKCKCLEHVRGALIEQGPPTPARLATQGAGDPAFAQTGGSGDQQVLMAGDSAAACKMRHDATVKNTRRAQVHFFDACNLTQGGELELRGQPLAVTLGVRRGNDPPDRFLIRLTTVNQQAEALLERQIVEGGRSSLLFQRLGDVGQAGRQQAVMGGMGQNFGPFSVVIAATTNVGVLEGGSLDGAFQKGAVEAGLEDRTDGRHGAGPDGDASLAGRVDTRGAIGFDQRQHPQAGAEALLGVRRVTQGPSGA